jgi:hypothetical protein
VIGILRKKLELSERTSIGQKAEKNEGAEDGQKRRSKSRLHAGEKFGQVRGEG